MNADDLESAGRAVLVDGRPDDDPSADLDAEEPAGYWRIFLIGLAVILAEIAFFWVFRSRLRPGAFTTLPPALVAFLLLVVTSARRQIRGAVRRTRFRAATRLGERGDARALGRLVEGLAWGERQIEGGIRAGLRTILPTIPALDDRTLTRAQRAILYSRLGQLDSESACTVLALIPATGDRFAIRHVRRLSARSTDAEVRKAAEECLAALRERFEKRKPEDVLLRPAESANPVESVLLRPAQNAPVEDSAQLLRPADREQAS